MESAIKLLFFVAGSDRTISEMLHAAESFA
jgi:hypothetical protein